MTLKSLDERERDRKLNRADKIYTPRRPYTEPIFETDEDEAADETADEPNPTGAPPASKRRKKPSWSLAPPLGYPAEPKAFENCCLLVSLILGKWKIDQHNYVKPLTKEHHQIVQYFRTPKKMCNNSLGHYLKKEMLELAARLGIPRKGPYKDRNAILKQVAPMWNVQICVYTQDSPPRINFLTPKKVDFTMPTIYLVLTVNGDLKDLLDHVEAVARLKTFINERGLSCPCCGKSSRSYRHTRHQCKVFKTCFVCHRYVATPQTYINEDNRFMFCDSATSLTPAAHPSLRMVCSLIGRSDLASGVPFSRSEHARATVFLDTSVPNRTTEQ